MSDAGGTPHEPYGAAHSGRSRIGAAIRRALERVTGIVLIALGLRLATERR